MSSTIAVNVPDPTGGHYELYEGITQQLGDRLGAGYPVYPWGQLPDGSFGPNGPPYNVTALSGDGSRIVSLSTPGAGFLLNGCPLNVIFGGTLSQAQATALTRLGISCGGVSVAVTAPVSGGPTNYGTTQQGGLTTFTPAAGTSSTTNSTVAAAISPSLTPGSPGSVPTGNPTQPNIQVNLGAIYRFIFATNPHQFDTGANYPGCSQVNTAMCDPQQFPTLAAAIAYANSRDEIPYIASSVAEVWGIINGTIPLDPKKVYGSGSGGNNTLLLIAAGIAAFFILRK